MPKEQSVKLSTAESHEVESASSTQPLAYAEAHAEVFFSVDQFRRALLRRVAIPEDLVEQALKVTHDKLFAKRIKYFSRKGVVTDERVVEDHTVQLQAADQIYSLASLYARERDAIQPNNGVAIEFDQERGVLRIVVGETRQNGEQSTRSIRESTLIPQEALVVSPPMRRVEASAPKDVFDWKVLTDEVVE